MRSLSLRQTLLAGGAALMLGGSAIGFASAQQTPTPPATPGQTTPARPGPQAFLDALARQLGVTTERLQQAMTEARTELGLPDRAGMKPRFGPGMPGWGMGRGGVDVSVAAQAIGITVQQLRQELPGKSLAQIAEAHGKDPAAVATALKSASDQRIDQAVAAGRLTAEQASQLKQHMHQRVDERLNQALPQGARGSRGPKHRTPGMSMPRI